MLPPTDLTEPYRLVLSSCRQLVASKVVVNNCRYLSSGESLRLFETLDYFRDLFSMQETVCNRNKQDNITDPARHHC